MLFTIFIVFILQTGWREYSYSRIGILVVLGLEGEAGELVGAREDLHLGNAPRAPELAVDKPHSGKLDDLCVFSETSR